MSDRKRLSLGGSSSEEESDVDSSASEQDVSSGSGSCSGGGDDDNDGAEEGDTSEEDGEGALGEEDGYDSLKNNENDVNTRATAQQRTVVSRAKGGGVSVKLGSCVSVKRQRDDVSKNSSHGGESSAIVGDDSGGSSGTKPATTLRGVFESSFKSRKLAEKKYANEIVLPGKTREATTFTFGFGVGAPSDSADGDEGDAAGGARAADVAGNGRKDGSEDSKEDAGDNAAEPQVPERFYAAAAAAGATAAASAEQDQSSSDGGVSDDDDTEPKLSPEELSDKVEAFVREKGYGVYGTKRFGERFWRDAEDPLFPKLGKGKGPNGTDLDEDEAWRRYRRDMARNCKRAHDKAKKRWGKRRPYVGDLYKVDGLAEYDILLDGVYPPNDRVHGDTPGDDAPHDRPSRDASTGGSGASERVGGKGRDHLHRDFPYGTFQPYAWEGDAQQHLKSDDDDDDDEFDRATIFAAARRRQLSGEAPPGPDHGHSAGEEQSAEDREQRARWAKELDEIIEIAKRMSADDQDSTH